MMSRYMVIWTVLLLLKADGIFGGPTDFYGPYNVATENPVLLFEVQGAREVNKFTSGGLYRAKINENAAIGTYVRSPVKMGLYVAEDDDEKIEYFILKSGIKRTTLNCLWTSTFTLEGQLIENFYFFRLKTTRMLSEESCKSYLVTINAQSRKTKRIIDTTQIIIEVKVSSNMPSRFKDANPKANIPSNFPLFQPILQLDIADRNKHNIGKVYFLLKRQSKYFSLNPVNGVLFLKRPLPRGSTQHDLIAYTRRWDSRLSRKDQLNTCKISVSVSLVNHYAPSISVGVVDNVENTANMIAANIIVSDRDQGMDGRIESFEIISGDEDRHFRLEKVTSDNTVFRLRLVKPIVNPKVSKPSLTFIATDKGNPPKSSTAVYSVNLVDALSTSVHFPKENYFVNVSEMVPINYTVIQVKALNLKPSSRFSYSIVHGDSSNRFRMESITGSIIVGGTLDAEKTLVYTLKIELNITGGITLATNVHIQVEDFNDHVPKFTSDNHFVEIQEDMALQTSIYKVVAKDGDSGDNGLVSYWLPDSDRFAIHPHTGVISVKRVYDRDSGIPEYAYIIVRAGDSGSPIRRETETMVKVKIKAWNDNEPIVKQNDCTISLSPDTPVGTKLLQIQAIDIDVDTIDQPSFSLAMGNTGNYFHINSISGDVSIAKPLGDARSSYSLVVFANDGTYKSLNSAFLQVTIDSKKTGKDVSCTDSSVYIKALKRKSEHQVTTAIATEPVIDRNPPQNIHAPRFTHREWAITVSEDLDIGSTLKTIKATDNDNGYEGLLNYYIVNGNINQSFDVDVETGELKSVGQLDREQVPKYELNISAWDLGISRKADFIKVVVTVKDVNDNAPIFKQKVYNISVSENTPVGRTVFKLIAKDDDEGINKRVTYHLLDDNDKPFFIDYNTGDLIINKPLDFEEEKSYDLKVLALDGSSTNQHVGQAQVIINVLDENDNPPIVNPVMQDIFVMKDYPVGSPITQVVASDPDSGDGGKVSFTLGKSYGSDLFSITDSTGLLKLKRSLTASLDDVYNLTVVVSDHGQPLLMSNIQVNIHIMQRISDEDVQIMSNQGGITKYSVPENSLTGFQIGQLTNRDRHSEQQNSFFFSIIDGTDITKFDLTETSGLLTTTESLDREEIPYYWLTIQVLTQQSRQFHNNIQLLIKVDDKNDNSPIFSPPVYESKIPENTRAEEVVVIVSAFDRDAGENGRLDYSIVSGNNEGHFKINKTTGFIITTKLPLDYEKKKMYQLVVKVTDNGSPPRSSDASLTILIQDENDNHPKYKDNLNIDVLISGTSDIAKDTLLGQVLASDEDQGHNGDITFSILSGDNSGKLRIDPKSGQLFSNVTLYSRDDAFQLQVEAKDNGNPSLSARTRIIVIITIKQFPFGQNPPTFPKKQVNITLPENTPVGHKIDITPATDKDFLVYFIKSGNEDQRFQLDSHGTSLKLIAKLDSAKKYHVVISATDGLYSTDFSLNIKVKDVNDHYPVPEMIEIIITVSENVSPGTKVVTVKASDLDTAGMNSKILFSFKSAINSKSLKLFDINENTGEIMVKGTLDYEDIRSHVLIVAITDSGYQPKESTMYVVVNVADVNEWKPQFIKPSYCVVIPKNIQSGSDIVKVFAKDKDQGVDAVLKYSISSGNHGFAFKIKPESGVIQTNKKLQASHISQYILTVEVRDDGADGLSASVNVTVSLLSRGHRPGFAKNVFPVSLYENQPINTIVEAIGFDGLMTFYTIMNRIACANDFQINPFTGVITTKKIFDAEKISSCHMRVKAQDGDGYSQESTVHVDIKDMNDNAPQMEEQVFIGYINENAPKSTLVLNAEGQPLVIAALDVDIEPNNRKLKYKIINPGMDSYFKIDENKGALFTSKFNLDYEIAQSYTFLVKVSDQGLPSLSELATVVVHVKNSNDVAPEFSKVVFEVLMYLPTINGVHVTTLTASDRDNLGNLIFSIKQQDTSLLIVNHKSGEITIADASKAKEGWYNAIVEVNDGKMLASANVHVLFKPMPVSALQFPRPSFVEHIRENTSLVQAVFTPFVRGYNTRERIRFSLRNLQDTFSIKESTGVIQTKPGVVIDREKISSFQLFIMAQDDSTPPRMAHSIVNVIVDDVNDCRPTFPPPPIFFVVPKSSETGSTIATITALDCDDGKNGEIRYEIKSDKSKKFGVDSRTGVLKVLGQLVGLTTPAEFTLIIEASDQGEKPLRSEAEVSVRIESGDACIFQKPSYNVELSEDTAVDKVFKRLHARCPDGKPVFNIISGDNFGQIVCDLNTGELSLTSKLDFEITTGYRLTIRAKDTNTGASSKTMVNIVVKDVNDNAPIFKGTPYFARVRENSPAGSRLMRVVAADLDSGANKYCSYEIVDDVSGTSSETFAIDPVTGILSVKKMLDYEKEKRFDVTVRVADHGQPSLSSKTLIRIFVTDLNDNAPTFQKSEYSATVLDNAGPNHFITQVLATDKDETDFEKLRYNIASGHGKNFFGIDAISGVVSLSQVPGLVLGKVYTLELSVNDGNFTSYTTLDVVVGQTNNHPPVFRTDVFHAQVTENYPADTYVAMVTATDHDSGAFGEVVYAIDNEKAAKDFKIDKVSGIITTRKPLDREVLSSITILIRATDRGGKSTFCYVMVDILDENDNQPQFLMPSYTGVVSITRASVGENVVRVTAVDLDEGENSELTYSLVGQISPFVFGINSSSGAITFLRKPRESTYNFYVRVTDKGRLKLRSYVQVRVFVMSLPFRFKHRTYPVSIYETAQGNISQKLQVIDKNGALVTLNIDYSIEVGSSPKTNKLGTFNIDSSGELQVFKNLDYETIDSYELTVRANRSSFSAYTTVHIKVLDKNDNIPEFESSLYVVNIPEDSPKGTRVVQVQAHDKDSKENGMVTYEMSAESKKYSNVFAVDNKTGWITSNGHLDRETVSSYTLRVTAKDHGKDKQFSSITSVNVNIDDVNDSPPVFSKILFVTSITEDSPIGTEVLSLNITDKDIKPRIVYYIVNGDRHNHFNVDQNSGKIYVKEKLDHELLPRYLLSITASDGAFTTSTLVKIEIIDVNDNKPFCNKLNLPIPVLENTTVGAFIAVVNATDKDEGNNSKIAFAIFNHHEKFSVDSITGIIKLDQRLDREKKSRYNFLVSASDGDGACYTNVTIDVLDINDSPPEFTKPRYIKLVPIDSEKNAFLLRVEATDKDIGLNRKLTYAFSNATVTNVFSIEKETGIISLQSRLLSRDEDKFVFNVVATDSGVPALSSESIVEIVVSTITNCSFVKNEYKSDIREDADPYAFDTVSAICSDRFNISYRIADDDAKRLFAMNEKKGTLSLKASLDYEYARVHNFDVEAFMVKKSGKTILISSSSIKVKVVDCNDNKPEFKKKSYEAMVNEDSSVGVVVVSVYASDNDTSETVTYSIIKSVPDDAKFAISSSGFVSVQGALDREKTEEYELLVRAQDSGKPPLSSNVTVVIKIKDVNDNPPVVKEEIKTLLPTNTVIGAVVFKLTATDADGPSNSKPFKFSVLSGENNVFHLNSSSGALTTKRRLFRHNTTYSMMIRTTDNGSPPMFTDTSVEITVVKFSLNPPKVRPVTVYVNMLTNDFKGGIVGKVIAHDPDNDDILQFSLLEDNAQFSIGRLDGAIRITSLLNRPSYSFVVQVTDGTHKVNTKVTARAKEITPIVVENSVGIRITGKTLSDFVSLSLSPMVDTLADIVSCTVDEVYLWSIQTSSENKLDIVFAIKKPKKQEFYDPNYLRKVLERQLTKFQRLSDVVVFSVGIFPCDEHHCTGAKECRNKIKAVNTWSILSSDTTTFLSYKNKQESECVCPEGKSALDCTSYSKCSASPCKSGLECVDRTTGYECVCPKGKNCKKECHGDKCHEDAMTFNGNSYIRYSLTDKKAKLASFSVSVKTTKPSGTILSVKGDRDYFITEIVEGKVRVRVDYGGGETSARLDQVKVNDGQWHELKVTRTGRNIRLTLNPGRYMTEALVLGSMRFLDVETDAIIVGGELPRRARRNSNAISNGYFGCMESPALDDNDLPLSGSNAVAKAATEGVIPNCSIAVCHPSFCQNDGQCKVIDKNGYKVPSCTCKPGFTGVDCGEDVNECDSKPCKNSGVCVNSIGSFKCNCVDKNFNGDLCAISVAAISGTEPLGTREFIYIGTTVFVLIIIAIIIACACRCWHKRRNKAKARGMEHERHEMKIKDTNEELSPHPPTPPPRRGDVDDPPTRLGSRAPSWDYADLPEMGPNRRKLSESESFIDLPSKSCEDLGEYSGANGIPQVPRRPRHLSDTQSIPDVPKKPSQYRCSRTSSQNSILGENYAEASEFDEEDLDIIRQGTKDIEKLAFKAADVVDSILGTRCASPPSECDTRSECSEVNELLGVGHLETYDHNEVDYFIPEIDQDNASDDETSIMLEKLPDVRHSRGEVLHKESQL